MKNLLHPGRLLGVFLILGLLGGYRMYHKIKIFTQAVPECTNFPTTAYTYETLAYTAPKQAEWKASRSQDEEGLWVYGLFHGPCLVYDPEGALVQAYPIYFKKNPLAADSFRLLQLEPLTYPFVFEGYYQAKVEAEYTFLLYDERSKKSFRLGLDEASDTPVQCVAFHSRQWDSQKQCLQDPVLELWDSAFQKKFALPLQQKLLLDQFSIVVSHSETACIQLSQVGDSAILSKGVVCLKKVHPHCRAILLEYKEAQSPYSDYFYLSL